MFFSDFDNTPDRCLVIFFFFYILLFGWCFCSVCQVYLIAPLIIFYTSFYPSTLFHNRSQTAILDLVFAFNHSDCSWIFCLSSIFSVFSKKSIGVFSANSFLTHCFNHFSLIWGATFNCILSSVCWSCKIWFCNKSLKLSIQCCHLFIFLHHISFCYYFAFIFESKSEFSNQDGQ